MSKNWKFSRFRNLCEALRFVVVYLVFQNLGLCCSLNEEGNALLKLRQRITSDPFGALSNWIDDEAVVDPCNWFGVECSDGKVVVLDLKDLCLGGTLAPELANLMHIKAIILRNNSFSGTIPERFVDLEELEILDLGYNNFSGHLPADLGSNTSLAILLVDNNELLVGFSPEIDELKTLSESQVDEDQLVTAAKMPACTERSITWLVDQKKGTRSLLETHKSYHSHYQVFFNHQTNPSLNNTSRPPPRQNYLNRQNNTSLNSTSPPPPRQNYLNHQNNTSLNSTSPPPPPPSATPPVSKPASPRQNASDSPLPLSKSASPKNRRFPIIIGVVGGVIFLLVSSIGIYLCKTINIANVRPWATGLSGQLQKAFMTGVPKLKRSDLVAACEDFSNVIGNSPIGTMYKGTLSSGVEIAVASVSVTSSKNWSKTLEAQFRKKVDTLSKVNHKNFVNLIGYCEEEEPFTRMLVFEYAPNGTLFEHLHIKEAESLDWGTRLRVAMGMAYCLQHMHQLDPPMILTKLTSSSIYLTDDYAAKISDLSFPNETSSTELKTSSRKHNDMPLSNPQSNVYSFGVLLLEMVTGRLTYSVDNGSLENWATHYLHGNQPLREMVDPILTSFQEDQLEQVEGLIRSCCHSHSELRPTMSEVSERLREITKITPESAVPKLSPLWWAELEISNSEAR